MIGGGVREDGEWGGWDAKRKYPLTGRTRSKATAHAAPVGRLVPAEMRPDTVLLPVSGSRHQLSVQSNGSRNCFVQKVIPNKNPGWRRYRNIKLRRSETCGVELESKLSRRPMAVAPRKRWPKISADFRALID